MKQHKYKIIYLSLAIVVIALLVANILFGSVSIPFKSALDILFGVESEALRPSWRHIILDSRLPQATTALLAGGALATAGLLLQTLFRNPLADPSILGVSSGANLGVAIVMLLSGGVPMLLSGGAFSGYLALVMAAFVGAGVVLAIIIAFSARVRSNTMLLIVGIMVGYVVSSLITMLNFQASSDKIHAFVMWGMGDFSGVSNERLPYFALFTAVGIVLSLLLIKPLNALLLGQRYAENLGVRVGRVRLLILLSTGLLTATTTAFCGPISFIGLAVPHIARLLLGTSNHNHLLPVTMLSGAATALLCSLLTVVWGDAQILPLNAITPLIGAPVIIYVIVNRRHIQYFN